MVQAYTDVLFEFAGADGLAEALGKVIIRDGYMALEVEYPGDRP